MLLIFDGLDELSVQGNAAAETTKSFLREVERVAERRNSQTACLFVLISSREVVVQKHESELRRPSQVLTLLPYFVPSAREYYDPQNLLERDSRQVWWKKYGSLTGKEFQGLPQELGRHDLEDVTAQPLLNYLVALSFMRGKLNFERDVSLNAIYADLILALYERGYENRRYGPTVI